MAIKKSGFTARRESCVPARIKSQMRQPKKTKRLRVLNYTFSNLLSGGPHHNIGQARVDTHKHINADQTKIHAGLFSSVSLDSSSLCVARLPGNRHRARNRRAHGAFGMRNCQTIKDLAGLTINQQRKARRALLSSEIPRSSLIDGLL